MINETIEVTVNGKRQEIIKDISLYDLLKTINLESKLPIILAKVDNRYKELSYTVKRPCTIEYVDILDKEGNRAYLNGLLYLMIYAGKNVLKKHNFIVQHSIDKGIYIKTDKKITKEDVALLKKEMKEVIKINLNIEKLNVNRIDAMDYFKSIGDESKVNLLQYNTNSFITLYKLGHMYNFFFSMMPVEVRCLERFDLKYLNENGFVLLYQTSFMKEEIKSFEFHKKVFEEFEHYFEWMKAVNAEQVSALNKIVSSGKIGDFIRIDETIQSYMLVNIARQIYDNKDKIKIVLIAGPSSSGKTTTCNKLAMYLNGFGFHPRGISMDNYFRARESAPLDEFGKPDLESIDCLDLDLFNEQIAKIIGGEEVRLPIYDFIAGKPNYTQGEKIKLDSKDILIVEGIHALNPALLSNVPKKNKLRIYIAPFSCMNFDNQNRISTTDNRLLRRIIRDNTHRGYKVEQTLSNWDSVRRGEERNIFPFQDEADIVFNTAHVYEMGVLKTYVEPLLYSVDINSPYYEEAKRLINMLKMFLPISSEDIPKDSIVREFIGGGCFKQ